MTWEEFISTYKVRREFPIHWGEMDAFQHLNNVAYFRYFESGRIAYFEEINFIKHSSGVAPILANASCRFLKPVFYPDQLICGARVVELHDSGFLQEYALFSNKAGGMVAKGDGRIVAYDYQQSCKTSLPPEIAGAIRELDHLS